MDNDRHPREQFTAEIRKLNEKCPSYMLSIEDLAAIENMCEVEDERGEQFDVQWAENGNEVFYEG